MRARRYGLVSRKVCYNKKHKDAVNHRDNDGESEEMGLVSRKVCYNKKHKDAVNHRDNDGESEEIGTRL